MIFWKNWRAEQDSRIDESIFYEMQKPSGLLALFMLSRSVAIYFFYKKEVHKYQSKCMNNFRKLKKNSYIYLIMQ